MPPRFIVTPNGEKLNAILKILIVIIGVVTLKIALRFILRLHLQEDTDFLIVVSCGLGSFDADAVAIFAKVYVVILLA